MPFHYPEFPKSFISLKARNLYAISMLFTILPLAYAKSASEREITDNIFLLKIKITLIDGTIIPTIPAHPISALNIPYGYLEERADQLKFARETQKNLPFC